MEDLAIAAETFAQLADTDADTDTDELDPPARYNQALCLAWLGRNSEAIRAFDQYVECAVAIDFEASVDAWTLAEVLRQGAGAESLADDFDALGILPWIAERGEPTTIDEPGRILPHFMPVDPATGRPQIEEAKLYEWIDRPVPEPRPDLSADDLPRILATIIHQPGLEILRFTTPDRNARFELEQRLAIRSMGDGVGESRTEIEVEIQIDWSYSPLPLPLLDVAAWRFRLPAGLEEEARQRLTREAIERYYEDRWIHLARLGLGEIGDSQNPNPNQDQDEAAGLTPLEAGRRAGQGDSIARARLSAVIALREQLAERVRHAPLYAGYPFDRLRRRVGLEPLDPSMIDPNDPSCMSPADLEALDPSRLDPLTRAEARRSALALRLEALANRFADA